MKKLIFSSAVVLTMISTSHLAHSAVLSISDNLIVAADGTVGSAANSGLPTNGVAFDYAVRERQNSNQTDRRVVSFLGVDTSNLTVAEVNTPGFQATFTVNHVGQLNSVNTGLDLSLGRNVSGDWDSISDSGDPDPQFAWAAASADQSVILADIHTVADSQALSLDVTSIVQGWVNGTFANQGLILLGTPAASNAGNNNLSQASYLAGAAINTAIVPEPSALILTGFGLLGFLAVRRR